MADEPIRCRAAVIQLGHGGLPDGQPLRQLFSQRIDRSPVNGAFAQMAAGEVARTMVVYDS